MTRSVEEQAPAGQESLAQTRRSIRDAERQVRRRRSNRVRRTGHLLIGTLALTVVWGGVGAATDLPVSPAGFWWPHHRHHHGHRPPTPPVGTTGPTASPTTVPNPPTTVPTSPATTTKSPTTRPTTSTSTAAPTTTTKPPASSTTTAPSVPSAPTGAWPGEGNTGPTTAAALKQSGDLTISQAGQTVSGLRVSGCVTVTAPNVTIKDSVIEGSNCGALVRNSSTGLTVQDSILDGKGDPSTIGVGYSNFTVERTEIRNVGDGVFPNGNATVRDSYIHTLANGNGTHNDGIQVTEGSNIVLDHNTVQNQLSQTSAVMLGADQGSVSNVTVSNNLLSGGGYALYGGKLASGSQYSIGGIKLIGNRFARTNFTNSGVYGALVYADYAGCTTSDNRWLDTKALVAG